MRGAIADKGRKVPALLSRYRKEILSVLILLTMWIAVVYLGEWEGLVFAIGTLLLGSDYKVLNYIFLEDIYNWIESYPGDAELAYIFWEYWYIDEYITPLDIIMWEGDDGRTVIDNPEGFIELGTELLICVKDSAGGETETHEYDLRLGTAEVTATEPSDTGKTVFLSVNRWKENSYYQDQEQRQKAHICRERLRDGNLEDDPFVKIQRPDELRSLGVNQWESLFEEIKNR